MSATPIPRTLSMVVYGDLDSSLIDDIPPGRQRVRTEVVDESRRRRVYDAVLRRDGEGHQVFVVYPTDRRVGSTRAAAEREGESSRMAPALPVPPDRAPSWGA